MLDLSVQKCMTPKEKEAAKQFRQIHFFDKRAIKDPYIWTFNHKDHAHFVLYKAGRLIGYAHIQYWPDRRAALRILVIDEGEEKRGYGSYLLKSCELNLKDEGVQILQTEAAPHAVGFYKHLGYSEMPFNDPENNPSDERDIPLGKRL